VNPRFDLESDHNFLKTLLDIGPTVPEEFFGEAQVISASKSWPQLAMITIGASITLLPLTATPERLRITSST
jgi:hypothetical protein